MAADGTCPDCGGTLIRKSRGRLLLAAALGVIVAASLACIPYVRIAAIVPVVISGYLLVWATRGRALWCRNCKRFPRRPTG